MPSILFRLTLVAFTFTLVLQDSPAKAAPPTFQGGIAGIELCPQSVCGAAIFIFEYQGLVDGRLRDGWGWMAMNHDDLPDQLFGVSAITGGEGAIYIGHRRYRVSVNGGVLVLIGINNPFIFDDDFAVLVSIDICKSKRQCREHAFGNFLQPGILSHQTLIPTIIGPLTPVGP